MVIKLIVNLLFMQLPEFCTKHTVACSTLNGVLSLTIPLIYYYAVQVKLVMKLLCDSGPFKEDLQWRSELWPNWKFYMIKYTFGVLFWNIVIYTLVSCIVYELENTIWYYFAYLWSLSRRPIVKLDHSNDKWRSWISLWWKWYPPLNWSDIYCQTEDLWLCCDSISYGLSDYYYD